ncbi:MAG: hypothetical protein K2I30_04390 [Clostridia bacterium]|nr:hypothetical protein [Clostridia bacterium]
MTENPLLEKLKNKLNGRNIFEVRQIARQVGVPQPTTGKKERLVSGILEIAAGNADPAAPSTVGRTPSESYDNKLVSEVFSCRAQCLVAKQIQGDTASAQLSVASGADAEEFSASGILVKQDGNFFMRGKSCGDVFVNETFVKRFKLRVGDKVSGTAKRKQGVAIAGLMSVSAVNGAQPEALENRADFDGLIPVYPDRRLTLSEDGGTAGRIIDLICPIGAGQRGIILSPHGTGKTTLLKNIALGLKSGGLKVLTLLINSRPEEISDFTSGLDGAEVFYCAAHAEDIHTAKFVSEYAKRLTECSHDTVLLIDGLCEYARSQILNGTTLPQAVEEAKSFLSAARNVKCGGSLTVIATLPSDGGELEATLCASLQSVVNMRLILSAELSSARIYPPVDILSSRTLRDEKLLSDDEIKCADTLRSVCEKHGFAAVLKLFKETADNAQLLSQILN